MKFAFSIGRLAALAALVMLLGGCSASSSEAEASIRKSTIQRGTIDQTVSATGSVHPEERSNLSFEQPGYVSEINVVVGSTVKAGDILARVNSTILDLSVSQAELRLKSAQVSFNQLYDPPSKAQIAGAQAAVASAVAAYNKVTAPADPEQVKVAQLEYEQAYQAYLKDPNSGIAVANLESARLQLQLLTAPADKNAVAAASAAITQAQATLDGMKNGPSEATVARAQNLVDQAQLALDRANRQRDGAILVAPYDGIVSVVNINPGALAPVAVPAIVLVDTTHLHVEVDVDEIDIGKVAPGQPALVEFDAIPNQQLPGQVTLVSPSATNSSGVVTYSVRIDLAPTPLPIRSGMTATADIVITRVADTLLVPNWAVRLDRTTGTAYASVLGADNKLTDVPVLLGIRSDVFSQVLAGLSEGQTVAVSVSPGSISVGPSGTQSSEGK